MSAPLEVSRARLKGVSDDVSESDAPGDGDADLEDDAEVAEQHDIAWPVPEKTMWPLAVVLAAVMVLAFGFDWVLVSIVPLAALLGVITVIDLRELRIPDKLTGPAAVAALPLLALSLLSDWDDLSLLRALLGALAMGGFYFLLWMIYPAGMGFGDVKLAPILGAQLAFFGWVPLVRGVIAAHFISGPIMLILLLFGRAKWKTGVPFGPFLVAGTLVALALEAQGY